MFKDSETALGPHRLLLRPLQVNHSDPATLPLLLPRPRYRQRDAVGHPENKRNDKISGSPPTPVTGEIYFGAFGHFCFGIDTLAYKDFFFLARNL